MSRQAYEEAARALRQPRSAGKGGTLDLRDCVRLAVLAASSHNSQPWRFRIGRDAVEILPDRARRCPAVDPDDAHLYKSLGCATENLVQAAAAQGFAARVAYDPATDRIHLRLAPGKAEASPATARAITHRQCTRLDYDGAPLATEDLAALEAAGQGEGVRTLLLVGRKRIEQVVDFVRSGDRVQLADPAFRRELLAWIRFNPRAALTSGDGLAGITAGRPALPDWIAPWLAGLVLSGRSQAALDTRQLRSSAGVAVTVAERNDRAAWIEAGRSWQRFGLCATTRGIRTAFVNQPIEVRALRPQLASWLGLGGAHPLLLTRFGRGPLAPYSLRRPLETVIETLPAD